MKVFLLDIAYMIHLATFVTALVGFAVFLWWWIKRGKATIVYAYVTGLFGATAASQYTEAILRRLWIVDREQYRVLVDSDLWGVRGSVLLFMLIAIVGHMLLLISRATKDVVVNECKNKLEQYPQFKERLLIVEDNKDVGVMLEKTLFYVFPNLRIERVRSAEEALAILKEGPADLILTDIRLPSMDGYAFVRQVQKSFNPPPIIGMTGYPKEDSPTKSMEAGFADFLIKPCSFTFLSEAVKGGLEKSRRWKAAQYTDYMPTKEVEE
jgi:CheY-like chemotaxis protein